MLSVSCARPSARPSAFALWLASLWVGLVLCLLTTPAAALSEDDFLPPEEAFHLSARMLGPDAVEVSWRIAPGYYLYHDQFAFTVEPAQADALGEPAIPRGQVIYDQVFEKDLETHREAIAVRVPLKAAPQDMTLLVTSQGCADAGLCYPPQTQRVALTAEGGAWAAHTDAPAEGGWMRLLGANDVGLADALATSSLWQTAAVFFVLGVLLSLTPCVLPMLPILSSLLVGDAQRQGQGAPRRLRGLGLAASYVLGMSLVYTAAGVAAGLTGASLAATLQTPWVLGVFATLLVVLALGMFGAFTFQVPASWQGRASDWANRMPGGRFTGAFGMGAVSALIVGPCVAAPLAGALLYISQTNDVALGAIALFALAWGMGVTLLLAGASAGTLLPRAGAWMEGVRRFFGVLLLAVAWWMLLPILPVWLQMTGWAVLALFAASLLRAFDALPPQAGTLARLGKGMGWLFAIVGVIQAVGLASGGRDPLQPLAHLAAARAPAAMASAPAPAISPGNWLTPGDATQTPSAAPSAWLNTPDAQAHPPFQRVGSVAELDAVIAQNRGRPVMLDFYADWCVSCKEMERFTFTDAGVAERMGQLVLVQADVTANNDDHRALLKRFRLFGPPGIIFFDAQGREQRDTRVIGFQNARRFTAVLDQVLARS